MDQAAQKKNWIGGEWREARSGRWLENRSAIDSGVVLHAFPDSSPDDVLSALDAAAGAQGAWAAMPAPARGAILFEGARILKRRAAEAAELMAREMGKPIREARGEIGRGVDLFHYYGSWGWRFGGERFPSATPGQTVHAVPTPLGVVSLITPWNFPFAIPAWKALPALVAGNAVVMKPASQAPASAILLAECLEEAGLPRGVLNVVCGAGRALSEPLLTDPRVRAVSFTGSCGVGQQVFKTASTPQRRVGLELGGKNPLIVMDDAPLDEAAGLAVAGAMQLAGQKCTATSRVIVLDSVAEAFVEKLLEQVAALKTGDPLDEATDVGPVIDLPALEGILEYIETGKREGARLVAGGERLASGDLAKGAYCAPTVFTDVEPAMTIAQEEIFGPVLAVLRARDLEHAIEIANGVAYGLSAAICTRNLTVAQTFIDRIDVGLVHVNSSTSGAEAHVPFGGMKASTSGFREMGRSGIDFFTTQKTIYYK